MMPPSSTFHEVIHLIQVSDKRGGGLQINLRLIPRLASAIPQRSDQAVQTIKIRDYSKTAFARTNETVANYIAVTN